jgi:hypothetical protein
MSDINRMAWTQNTRHTIGAANYHSLSAWRFAPAIQRMQRTAVLAEKHRDPLTADPRRRYVFLTVIQL